MPVVIIFIVIALAVSTLGSFFSPKKEIPLPQANLSQIEEYSKTQPVFPAQSSSPKAASQIKEESPILPLFSIDTFIKYGPLEKEVIDDTNRVVFEFGARVSPPETEGQILFETKVEGFDDGWKEIYSPEREISLPPGVKEYTFLVRAKINNVVDSTPAKRTFKLNISPYFDKIKISWLETPTFDRPSLITLTAYIEKNENIDITGWEIKGKNGNFIIPQGIEEFNPLITPLPSKDIIVKQWDRIYISSESNPLGRKDGNFRPNKCMGYLFSSHNFTIPISKNCPRPESEKLPRYLEKCCREYVLGLGSCESPTYQGMADYNLFKDSNCLYYLSANLNYGGCFANYYQEQNLSESEWHIYMDRREKEIMDEKLDTIYLRDKAGLLVNKYNYGEACCR